MGAFNSMYHLELRQFPHNLCRFNLTEQQLRAVVEPWVREKPLELGERKWSIHQAKLKVLEGPRLPVEQLSMGRGWRAAQRQSEDVTERVLAAVETEPPRDQAATSLLEGGAAAASLPETGLASDPLDLAVQLASLLGGDPALVLSAWRRAAAASPELSPSESLAAAEAELRTSSAGHA